MRDTCVVYVEHSCFIRGCASNTRSMRALRDFRFELLKIWSLRDSCVSYVVYARCLRDTYVELA